MVVRAVKRMRSWPPINRPATTLARSVARVLSLQPEFLPRHLHRVGSVSCTLPDRNVIRLWSRGDDWVSNQLFWFGWRGYEPESVPAFAALAAESAVILDVGAYVGFYSVVAGRANPRAQVHAFEPMPAIYARLEQNIALNELTNVAAHRVALGPSAGTSTFYYLAETELPTSSSLSPSFTTASGLQEREVAVTTLDRFAAENPSRPIGLIKLDTETTEPEVLRGGRELLQRDRPHILCEVLAGKGTAHQLEECLDGLRYNYYLLTAEGPRKRERIDAHPQYLNYLFTRLDPESLQMRIDRWMGK